MIFFALSLLLAWIVGFVQGDHNFSASTGCLDACVEIVIKDLPLLPLQYDAAFPRRYYDLGNLNNYTRPCQIKEKQKNFEPCNACVKDGLPKQNAWAAAAGRRYCAVCTWKPAGHQEINGHLLCITNAHFGKTRSPQAMLPEKPAAC